MKQVLAPTAAPCSFHWILHPGGLSSPVPRELLNVFISAVEGFIAWGYRVLFKESHVGRHFGCFRLSADFSAHPESGRLAFEAVRIPGLPWTCSSVGKESACNAGAAAATKSLQSCPTLCNSIDSSPPGSPTPGILQARTLEWVAISFSRAWKWKAKVKTLSRVRLLATPWAATHPAPPSMGFSRQEYWSGVPLPSPLV